MRVEHIDAPLNSSADEWDPCIAPDGSFLVFCSTRPGGCGGSDLYVSFTDGHGGWTLPINLGDDFNSAADEYAPSLSPDGRFLFFTRHDGKRGELYWVRTSALERFRAPSKPNAAPNQSAEVTGPYFGQTPPGRTPQIFAPGILSLPNRMEARIVFSPDGDECFFTVPNDFTFSNVQLYYSKCVDNVWTPQRLAPFAQPGHAYLQPFFSADGKILYFTSNQNGSYDIWSVGRTATGWGKPLILPTPINGFDYQAEYSQTTDGTAYVESTRPGGTGKIGLWRIQPPLPGQPSVAEHLGGSMDSGTWDSDPYVSPDGKQLFFSSGRPGGCGGADLYVTTPDGNGGWTTPVNLNAYCPGINTGAIEYGPSLSPDGRYLFFVRLDPKEKQCDVWWVANPFAPKPAK
jgi:Tol biopolymer transport system component